VNAPLQLQQLLRRRGFRLTPQRRAILEALEALDGHLTVEDIHRTVAHRLPGIDLSTVYRAVRLLSRLGVLDRHELAKGGAVYELHREPAHGHFVCERCGRVTHLDTASLAPVSRALRQTAYGTARRITVTLLGTCPRCAPTRARRPSR
jgi:Fur family ferric uptake transcriptional regulator